MATDWDRWAELDTRASSRAGAVAGRAVRLSRGERAPAIADDPSTRIYLGVGAGTISMSAPRTIDLTDRRPDDDREWLDALARRLTPLL